MRKSWITRSVTGAMFVACAGLSATALGMFAQSSDAPVERLLANLEKALKDKPNDADAHYRLARVHSLAFTHGSKTIRVYGESDPVGVRGQSAEKPLPVEERVKHLKLGIEHYYRAIALTPGRAAPRLGLASLLEAALPLAGACDANPSPPISTKAADSTRAQYNQLIDAIPNAEAEQRLKSMLGIECTIAGYATREWNHPLSEALVARRDDPNDARRVAIRSLICGDCTARLELLYFQAFTRALETDTGDSSQPMRGPYVEHPLDVLVSYEAANAFVRLVEARGATECDKVRLATAKAAIAAYSALPPSNAVTPIVFPINGSGSVSSLSRPGSRVSFDLDGTGRAMTWSWVSCDTGILVWDPHRTGKITSGRQLFGSVSWWVFFENGYQALDALDDDRNGQLSGDELRGISVWIDRNSNGVSDPGEVEALDTFGVRSIAVHTSGIEDGCLSNREGLFMADGRVFPTYDWVGTPVSSGSQPSRLARTVSTNP